jgi:uncharacterized metal-binding protein YceD (DUF177 family)
MAEKIDTKIQFSGLKSGKYNYDFTLNKTFFLTFENENLEDGEVIFSVLMEKGDHLLTFYFSFKGYVRTICDRCLRPLDVPVSGEEKLYVKFSDTESSDDENIMIIPENEHQLDLSQVLYEYVATALPMRCVHPTDENGQSACDSEMIDLLEGMQHQDNNEHEIDPRWEKLKELKIK